jgi:hypothetical protein
LRRKKPPPEFVTFWAEIAKLGGGPVTESIAPAYPRTPAELNRRAERSALMRLGKQNRHMAKAAKKTAEH